VEKRNTLKMFLLLEEHSESALIFINTNNVSLLSVSAALKQSGLGKGMGNAQSVAQPTD